MAETGAAADLNPSVVDPAAPNLTTGQRVWAIVGGSAGNLVEWYDWFAYSLGSVYFAAAFFPSGSDTAQWWKAAVVNIVSFGARPFGAWAMGLFADRFGRKAGLIISVLMMCGGSLAIACTPTFDQIGVAAVYIMVAARLLQGLSVGGQYGATAAYMSEMAKAGRRGFWSSFLYVTLIGGQLLAAIVIIALQTFMPESEIKAWGWRIIFFIGAALALVVFFVQSSLHESHSFKNAKAAGMEKARTHWLFTRYWRETIAIFGLTAAGTSAFYAYTTYFTKFLSNTAHFTKPQASTANFWILIVFMLSQPLFGWLADKYGRRTTLLFAFVVNLIVAYPVYTFVAQTDSVGLAVLAACLPLVCLSGYTAISAVVKAELFPANIRALGVAFPYAISNAVFGGLVEPLALGWKKSGTESYFYIYLAAVMVLGVIGALMIHETKHKSLILED